VERPPKTDPMEAVIVVTIFGNALVVRILAITVVTEELPSGLFLPPKHIMHGSCVKPWYFN
jgi:hypothetical protein